MTACDFVGLIQSFQIKKKLNGQTRIMQLALKGYENQY